MNGFKRNIKKLTAAALALLLLFTAAVPALAQAFSAIVTSNTMTVYGDAALEHKLGSLKKNAVVRIVGYSTAIAKISYNGNTGYAKITDMQRVDDVATKAVLNAAAPVYQSPMEDSEKITAPQGTQLYVLATSGDWAQVERNGFVGYVKTDAITQTDDQWNLPAGTTAATTAATPENGITVRTYYAVTVENMRVYKAADTKAKALGTLKPGIQVTVLATSGDGWAYIELKGKHGYCKLSSLREGVAEDYVSPTSSATSTTVQAGVVSAERLTVYEQADTGSRKLGTLKQGQSVDVVSWTGEWAYIQLDGHRGYCALAGLSKANAAPTTTPAPDLSKARTGTVTADTLAVYAETGDGAQKLGTLRKGQTVNVLQIYNNWAWIELNGNTGYCKAKGLSVSDSRDGVPAGFRQASFTATVVAPEARVYASTSTDAENVALRLGAEVQVVAYNANWACVNQNGSYGFVAVKALSRAEYASISGDGAPLQTLLKALLSGGYYDAEPSTSYNAAAIAAIKRFQSACGLETTGVADQTLQRILYSGYAPSSSLLFKSLSSGEKGDSVSRLQARLYALGYLSRTASLDGEYGSATVAAVKLFQNASGIEATGTSDPATLKALYSPEAKRLPAGTKAADASTGSTSSSSGSSTYLNNVPNGLASTTSAYSEGMSHAEKLEHAIYLCQSKLGKPYVYGATGPDKFDCSGLTTWAFKALGVSLKRSAYAQGYDESFPKVEGAASLRRGDIVFFNTISDSDLSDHAGIYIGDGYFIHASSGAHKVVVSNLTTGFYGRVFSWGRRILN